MCATPQAWPGEATCKPQPAEIDDWLVTTDCGEVGEIAITERPRGRFARQPRGDDASDIGALLLGDRRDAGQRTAGPGNLSRIADHKDFRVSGQCQVRANRHPAAAPGFDTEPCGGG